MVMPTQAPSYEPYVPSPDLFHRLFPFHFVLADDLKLVQVSGMIQYHVIRLIILTLLSYQRLFHGLLTMHHDRFLPAFFAGGVGHGGHGTDVGHGQCHFGLDPSECLY